MRRVAAGLGTGAASLYRYLETREDLLDLMIDATGAEYVFTLATPPAPPRTSPPHAATDQADRYRDILARILSGLLAPKPSSA